jgi:hypothetical protein
LAVGFLFEPLFHKKALHKEELWVISYNKLLVAFGRLALFNLTISLSN